MLCVLVVFITTTEPLRKSVDQEKAKDKESIVDSKSKLYTLISTPSVFLVLLQGLSILAFDQCTRNFSINISVGIPGCLPWGFIGVFLNDYFSSEGRMSVEAATAVMGAFSIGAFIGQLAGGWAGQQLYNIGIGAFNNIFIIIVQYHKYTCWCYYPRRRSSYAVPIDGLLYNFGSVSYAVPAGLWDGQRNPEIGGHSLYYKGGFIGKLLRRPHTLYSPLGRDPSHYNWAQC